MSYLATEGSLYSRATRRVSNRVFPLEAVFSSRQGFVLFSLEAFFSTSDRESPFIDFSRSFFLKLLVQVLST